MTNHDGSGVRARLLGSWSLVRWESIGADGQVGYPLGENAVGQLMYDGEGDRVSAQLVRANQQPFVSDDWQQAGREEMCRAWPSYFGYFGRFTIDARAAIVTHHIDAGWFPNLTGTQQVRHYRLDGEDLVLDADTAWGQVRIIWRKTTIHHT
jgi:hypothetical protein